MAKIGIAASQITGQAASGGGGGTTITAPFMPQWIGTGWGSTTALSSDRVSSANKIVVVPFWVPWSQQMTNMIVNIVSSDAGHNSDFGIYDTSGNLKAHVGAQAFSSTGVTSALAFAGGTITLSPGIYLWAGTSAATTLFWSAMATDSTGTNAIFYYSTASTATSGALPSTITVSASASASSPSASVRSGAMYLPIFMTT